MRQIKNREYKCERCGNQGIWLEQKLTLHVDHKDGDRYNNQESNHRYLCPNCHSQTDTYCGRNKQKHHSWKEIPEKEIVLALKQSKNITETMLKLKMNSRNQLARNYVKEIQHKNDIDFTGRKIRDYDQKLFDELVSSKIEFQKYGWVQQASKILNVEPQKVSNWLKLRQPEFYFEKCYKRKLV